MGQKIKIVDLCWQIPCDWQKQVDPSVVLVFVVETAMFDLHTHDASH